MVDSSELERIYSIFKTPPESKEELKLYIKVFFGIDVPDKVLEEGHSSPMDYVWWSWQRTLERLRGGELSGDCTVLANRGGGKTLNGAILSMLEAMFLKGASIRILGGCLTGDSYVLTPLGYRRVRDVKVGDVVYSGTGEARVLEKFVRKYNGEICRMGVGAGARIEATPEHLFLTPDGWKPIGELKGQKYVEVARQFKRGDIRLDPDVAFTWGFFLLGRKLKRDVVPYRPRGKTHYVGFSPRSATSARLALIRDKLRAVYKKLNDICERKHPERSFFYVQGLDGKGKKITFSQGSRLSFNLSKLIGLGTSKLIFAWRFNPIVRNFIFSLDQETLEQFLLGLIMARAEFVHRDGIVVMDLPNRAAGLVAPLLNKAGIPFGFFLVATKSAEKEEERMVRLHLPCWALRDPLRLLSKSDAKTRIPSRIEGDLTISRVYFREEPRRGEIEVYDLVVDGGDSFATGKVECHNSLKQSEKMYLHLYRFMQRPFLKDEFKVIERRVAKFKNGSTIEILPHSVLAVRSEHVDIFRCDELDEFNKRVWDAVHFATKRIEKLSTRSTPNGLMAAEIERARREGEPIFNWSFVEIGSRCVRRCEICKIQKYCRGALKKGVGYKPVSEILAEYARSPVGFELEMANLMPMIEDAIFTNFRPKYPWVVEPIRIATAPTWLAIDYGHRDPCVCLFIQYDKSRGRYYVVDQIYVLRTSISAFGKLIKSKIEELHLHNIIAAYGDPSAALARAELLDLFGIFVIHRRSAKDKRVNAIKELFELREDGFPLLQICSNCKELIREVMSYDSKKFTSGRFDDCIEALGYWAINCTSVFDYTKIWKLNDDPEKIPNSSFRRRISVEIPERAAIIQRLTDVNPRPFSGNEF